MSESIRVLRITESMLDFGTFALGLTNNVFRVEMTSRTFPSRNQINPRGRMRLEIGMKNPYDKKLKDNIYEVLELAEAIDGYKGLPEANAKKEWRIIQLLLQETDLSTYSKEFEWKL